MPASQADSWFWFLITLSHSKWLHWDQSYMVRWLKLALATSLTYTVLGCMTWKKFNILLHWKRLNWWTCGWTHITTGSDFDQLYLKLGQSTFSATAIPCIKSSLRPVVENLPNGIKTMLSGVYFMARELGFTIGVELIGRRWILRAYNKQWKIVLERVFPYRWT